LIQKLSGLTARGEREEPGETEEEEISVGEKEHRTRRGVGAGNLERWLRGGRKRDEKVRPRREINQDPSRSVASRRLGHVRSPHRYSN
jgi:hypothetical protein